MQKKLKLNFMQESVKMMNKRADISITLLVFLTLFLTITALFIFNTSSNDLKLSIADSSALNDIHAKEVQINYYIQEMVDSSAESVKYKADVKTAFITDLKNEIEKYQESDKSNTNSLFLEFNQLKNQINEKNVELLSEYLLYTDKNTKGYIITNCGVDLHGKHPFIKNIKVIKVPTSLK